MPPLHSWRIETRAEARWVDEMRGVRPGARVAFGVKSVDTPEVGAGLEPIEDATIEASDVGS